MALRVLRALNKPEVLDFTSRLCFYKQTNKTCSRSMHLKEYNFDSDEEIVENFLPKVMLIGINLPEQKNVLTENALDMLLESIRKFSLEKDITAAILHGCGGNFCAGIQPGDVCLKKSEKVIKSLYELKKPILASLDGYITDFGCQLATMCDIKIMDETALIGFGDSNRRTNIFSEVYERLVATVGLSTAMLLILPTYTCKAQVAQHKGLVNLVVACGASLGQAINTAKSISTSPCELAIERKSHILSLIKNNS